MVSYLAEARRLLREFKHIQMEHISRDLNRHVDALASLASAVASELRRIISVEVQNLPSVGREANNEVCSINQSTSWMTPILAYLKDDVLPGDQKEADRIRRITGYQKKVISTEGHTQGHTYVVFTLIPFRICCEKFMKGCVKAIQGGRSLAHRAIGQGYWWPYMQKDATQYVKKCDKCQRFAPSIHQPVTSLNPIASPWPFS